MPDIVCSIAGCTALANVPGSARGWCRSHYKRWYRRGDPTSHTPARDRTSVSDRFWAKVDRGQPNECWEWTASRDDFGYGFFRVDQRQTMRRAHRVAWELTNGPIPDGLKVCHHCDNPPCCNPACLFLGTDADNSADKCRKGRSTKGRIVHCGEGSGRSAKLSRETVEAIIVRYSSGGISQEALGAMYGASQTQIGRIVRGERWTLARQLPYL